MKPGILFVYVVILGFMLFALSGCAAPPQQAITQTVIAPVNIDAALLDCGAEPPIPTIRTPASRAQWVAQDWAFGRTCHDNLSAVKQVLSPPKGK